MASILYLFQQIEHVCVAKGRRRSGEPGLMGVGGAANKRHGAAQRRGEEQQRDLRAAEANRAAQGGQYQSVSQSVSQADRAEQEQKQTSAHSTCVAFLLYSKFLPRFDAPPSHIPPHVPKKLAIDISDEVKDQNRMLDGMDGQMGSADDLMSETMGKLGTMLNSPDGKHML